MIRLNPLGLYPDMFHTYLSNYQRSAPLIYATTFSSVVSHCLPATGICHGEKIKIKSHWWVPLIKCLGTTGYTLPRTSAVLHNATRSWHTPPTFSPALAYPYARACESILEGQTYCCLPQYPFWRNTALARLGDVDPFTPLWPFLPGVKIKKPELWGVHSISTSLIEEVLLTFITRLKFQGLLRSWASPGHWGHRHIRHTFSHWQLCSDAFLIHPSMLALSTIIPIVSKHYPYLD